METGIQAVGITPFGATSGVVGAGNSASYNAAGKILTFSIDADFSATGTPSIWTMLDTQYNSSPPNIDFNIDQGGQIHIFIMGTDYPTGVSITRGVWNNYKLQVNFINDTVSAFYNGAPVLQGVPFSSTGTSLGFYAFYAQGASSLVGTDSGYYDNLSVTASAIPSATLVSIAVTPTGPTIPLGTTLQLTAKGAYGDGSNQNLTSAVSWSSSNTAVATINTSGSVTGVSAGTCTITATSGSVTGTSGLTVGSSAPGSGVQISSLSLTTVDPLAPLTITGTGFDPANAAISVLLIPESGGLPTSVPAVAATSTTAQISVPPFLNMRTGTFTAGTVDVQVIQLDGDTLATSNVVTGLQINAPPAIPAGVAPGAITLEFLAVSMNVSSTIQLDAATNSSLANLAADLSQYDADLRSLVAAIGTISNDPSQSVTVATANGLTFSLNAQVLSLSDQLSLTYVQQFVAQMGKSLETVSNLARTRTESELARGRMPLAPTPAPKQASTTCPSYDGGGAIDQVMCQTQQQSQDWQTIAPAAVQLGAKIESGFYLGFLGGWAVAGLAEAGAIGETAAQAYQIAWSAASSHIAAFVTASQPPPLSDSLKGAAAQVLDNLLLGGIGILPTALDSFNNYKDASALVPSSAGQAPQGGLVLTAPQSGAPSGTTAVNAFQIVGGSTTATQLAAPGSQQVTSISTITVPPLMCTFAQQNVWNNHCTATYNSASVCNTGTLLQQLECVNAAIAAWEKCLDSCTLP